MLLYSAVVVDVVSESFYYELGLARVEEATESSASCSTYKCFEIGDGINHNLNGLE